jgi:hypothetical protein
MPVSLSPIRNLLHAITRKLVTEVFVSSLATLIAMAVFSYVTKPAPRFVRDEGRLSSFDGGPIGGEKSEALADFMERVALSHVASLKAPPAAPSQATLVAASEHSVVPLPPPRPADAARHDRPSSGKVHVAVSVPKVLPSAEPPLTTTEPTVVPAPVKEEPLRPLQYGMRVAANLGDIVSASNTLVVESVASMGDALSSIVKKL